MKKIILIGLIALSPLMAFTDRATATVSDTGEGLVSSISIGGKSFKYASSRGNSAEIEEFYCDNGDEGYSVKLSNGSTIATKTYNSCTGETTISRYQKPVTAQDTANAFKASMLAFEAEHGDWIAASEQPRYNKNEDQFSAANMGAYLRGWSKAADGTWSSMNVRTDGEDGRVGAGLLIRDTDGDGKNDYTYGAWTGADSKYHYLPDLLADFEIAEGFTGEITIQDGVYGINLYKDSDRIEGSDSDDIADNYSKRDSRYQLNDSNRGEGVELEAY